MNEGGFEKNIKLTLLLMKYNMKYVSYINSKCSINIYGGQWNNSYYIGS